MVLLPSQVMAIPMDRTARGRARTGDPTEAVVVAAEIVTEENPSEIIIDPEVADVGTMRASTKSR